MSRLLYRLGRGAAVHPWRTLSAWLVVAAAVAGLAVAFGGTPHDDYDVPKARAQVGIDQLRAHLPGAGNTSARVVRPRPHRRPDRTPPVIAALTGRLRAMPHVVAVSPPSISADGDTAVITVGYDAPVTDADLMGHLEPLEQAVAPTRASGLQVELGGELPESAAAPMEGRGELIGIVAALVILVLAFGAVTSAGLPIGTALVGLGIGSGGISLLAAATDVSTAAPMVATMVGLGVGIDYALLLVTRHVEHLQRGLPVAEAPDAPAPPRDARSSSPPAPSSSRSWACAWPACRSTARSGSPPRSPSWPWRSPRSRWCRRCAGLAGLRLLPREFAAVGRVRRPRRGTSTGGVATTAVRTPLTARWAARVGRRPAPVGGRGRCAHADAGASRRSTCAPGRRTPAAGRPT